MHRLILVLMLCLASPAAAQHNHSSQGQPKETGQAAFAAIAEIVALLESDPNTDWSRVDIDGLRKHLVDMDLVTTHAEISRTLRPQGARFEVRGTPRTSEAIRAMVPSHAPFLASETGWQVSTEELEDGVALIVDGHADMIQGLGFFGLMAIGAHHQRHHLTMAKGLTAH